MKKTFCDKCGDEIKVDSEWVLGKELCPVCTEVIRDWLDGKTLELGCETEDKPVVTDPECCGNCRGCKHDSLIEESRAFTRKCVDEWLYKIPTKREEMWDEIFALHKKSDVIIVVKKEDVNTFLHELENKIPEITWASDVRIFEAKGTIKDIYGELKTHNRIYFRLSKKNKLSYSSNLNTYLFTNLDIISYLPPMRWDLFKKGRLAVKVNYDDYKDFYAACEKELGKRPVTAVFTEDFTVSICKKDGLFEIFTIEDQKKTGRKIVDWEDVRCYKWD